MGGFEDDCLAAHNKYRKKHGVPTLKYNRQVANIAQRWAEELARSGRFQHSPDRKCQGEQLGENITMKWTSGNHDFTGEEVTKQWYDEISKYDFGRHGGPGTGHFTQVVWKDSRELGVGRAQGRDGKWIVVANYMPAGNWVGRNAQNVFPPGGGSAASGRRGRSDSSSSSDSEKGSQRNSRGPVSTPSHRAEPKSSFDSSPFGGGRSQTSSSRTVTHESRDSGSPRGYRKCVVTETTIGPDGQKRTVTRETVTQGGSDGSDDFNKRFEELRSKHGFSGSSRDNSDPFGRHDFGSAFDSSSFGDRRTADRRTDDRNPPRPQQPQGGDRMDRGGRSAQGGGGSQQPQNMKEFIDDVVKSHNKYRKKHGRVGDLKHNGQLSELAQRWAEHLAATSVLKHSNDSFRGEQLGENVATKWGSAGADYNGQDVTDQWYKEVEKYDFRRNDYSSGTGHFTQIVWKGSKEVGVGKAFGRDGRVFVVCNYLPAGNVMGRFQDNVFPG